MFKLPLLATGVLLTALAAPAFATDLALAGNGAWQPFKVSDIEANSFGTEWISNADSDQPGYGTPLNFTFTIAAGSVGTLTVLDAGFAGDIFSVTNFGGTLGNTSLVPVATYDSNAPSVGDFDLAFADLSFSRGSYTLGAGSYSITGALAQSVLLDPATPLNSTIGAVRLTVSAVPEPETYALMLAGLGMLCTMVRRSRS